MDILVLSQVVCIVTWDEQVVDFLPLSTVCGNTVYVETIVAPNLNQGGPVGIEKSSTNVYIVLVIVPDIMSLYTLISD